MNIGPIQYTTPVVTSVAEPAQVLSADQRSLIHAIKAINASQALGDDQELTYSVDRVANLVVAKLVNKTTGEVIEQIPAEYIVRLAEEVSGG